MRDAFSDTLVALAEADPQLLLLTGDHGYALFDEFRKRFAGQYINAGIAEQNMVGMAAGLARAGFRPIVYGLSAFVPIRVLEQIKLDIAHDDLPVVLVGDGAGFVYSHLGTSHQSTEDIACARSIPGLATVSPADRHELSYMLGQAYNLRAPVYFRMGKSDRGDVHAGGVTSAVGALLQVRKGAGPFAVLATGSMVRTALDVVQQTGIDAPVFSVPWIKPIDEEAVAGICRFSRGVVVMEEHSVYGGLGGAVAEIAARRAPVRILQIGVADRFSDKCGTYAYLLREHGLDADSVSKRVEDFVRDV
jgi:transketolase